MENLNTFLSLLNNLIKPNPEAQRIRLKKKRNRAENRILKMEERNIKQAEKEVEKLKKDLTKDADGYTEQDRLLIEQLNQRIINRKVEVIGKKLG